MKKILLTASVMTVIGGAAFAGGFNKPVVESNPVPAMAPAPVAQDADWTGFYLGADVGYGKPNGELKTDGALGGVNAGYLWDFNGSYVLGGEIGYNAAHMDQGADGKLKNMTDVKLIGGVPVGNWLPYATVGASYVKADLAGDDHSDTVPMIGVGVKYALDNNWSVGSEIDYRKGHDFDSTGDSLNLTSIAATVSYRF